ncbi:TetR/AcrR family transcriptional regulator [Saccharomonospora piscinae]|uniref:TetR/AcrR family transcriptional regulator n=1 Tax=Saccharomonospora piscinae TaxID=687388 RepID=UPI00046387CF|nr:TetR/AcrR family transcriptional regulator [Saccharomonospora piscinae]
MGSPCGSGERPATDLTARARIRDAALAQFAEHGTKGATIKSIADAAGVSVGLVQHHFGSKAALRDACDDVVVEIFRQRLSTAAREGELGDSSFMAALFESSPPLLRYLGRIIIEDTPAATAVLDQLASGAEDFLTGTWPDRYPAGSQRVRDAAAVMAAMHSGVTLLHGYLTRRMGAESGQREQATRVPLALLDLYAAMGEYVTSPDGERIRAATNAYRHDTEEETRHDGHR